jgi:hypothetical protein
MNGIRKFCKKWVGGLQKLQAALLRRQTLA